MSALWRRARGAVTRLLGRPVLPEPLRPSQVFAVALEGERPVRDTLRRLTPDGDFAQAAMAPNGECVACWGVREGVEGYQLYLSDIESVTCRQLTHGAGLNGHPAWSPDSASIVYFSSVGVSELWEWRREKQFSPDRTHTNLFRIDPASGLRQQITHGPWVDERPAVNASGREIVFVSNRSGRLNLWVVEAGGEPVQITEGLGPDYRPQFSPDGRRIVFFTAGAPGAGHQLAMMAWPERSPIAITPRTRFDWVHGPCWSADGAHLLAHAQGHGDRRPSLWVIDVESGACERLAIPGVPDGSHGTWDDQRRWLAFDTRTALGLPPALLLRT
jgi:Tol biopolymer transport system component